MGDTEADLRGTPVSRAVGKDFVESSRLAERVGAEPKRCYWNCFNAIHEVPGYEKASYVEGYAVDTNGFFFEHAWMLKDGFIIDPTLPVGITRYIAGLEFIGISGLADFLETVEEEVGALHNAFHWGYRSPSYCRAFLEAHADVQGFTPPEAVLAMAQRVEQVPGTFSTSVPAAGEQVTT